MKVFSSVVALSFVVLFCGNDRSSPSHARNINNELLNSLENQAFCDAARHVTDGLLR